MRIVAGILLLSAGVVAPMVMLLWINGRLNRQPAPRPAEVSLLLAFNGVLPVGLIIEGLRLLSPRVAASPVLRTATIAAGLASVLLLSALLGIAAATRRTGDHHGG